MPGGFSRVSQAVASVTVNINFGFFVYYVPTFGYGGGLGREFGIGLRPAIGVFLSVVSEIKDRLVRFDEKNESDEPIQINDTKSIGDQSNLIRIVEQEALKRVAARMFDGFKTRDQAAYFLHDQLYPLSREYGVEIAARIYKRERRGRWVFTPPNTDGLPKVVTRTSAPDDAFAGMASVWHTHPSGAVPSSQDTEFGNEKGIALYVSHMVGGTPVLSVVDYYKPKEFFRPVERESE